MQQNLTTQYWVDYQVAGVSPFPYPDYIEEFDRVYPERRGSRYQDFAITQWKLKQVGAFVRLVCRIKFRPHHCVCDIEIDFDSHDWEDTSLFPNYRLGWYRQP